MSSEEKENLDFAFSLFEKFGQEPYIGEAVSQLQHAQQAAALAEKEGFGDHVIIGWLDFVYMVTHPNFENLLMAFGMVRHPSWAVRSSSSSIEDAGTVGSCQQEVFTTWMGDPV